MPNFEIWHISINVKGQQQQKKPFQFFTGKAFLKKQIVFQYKNDLIPVSEYLQQQQQQQHILCSINFTI